MMQPAQIHCWDIFELALAGPETGNPFRDVRLVGRFQQGARVLEAEGFYDGGGVYRLRFMPDTPGEWRYVTSCNLPELDGVAGALTCLPARPGVHGPVRVADTYHFAYADGTRHFSIGTTCYAWTSQPEALQEQTLRSLADSPFNKIRMCVFPKDYTYNKNEPDDYAFERAANGEGFDFSRLNPVFFQRFERRVAQLGELGIEADVILFHPYDRWGFSRMTAETDERYLRYVIARLAAFRNVWWSLANEYDILKAKTMADWDRFFRILQTYDPYQHLRSIHNWQAQGTYDTRTFYDHGKPWVTHCSVQHGEVELAAQWRELYRKPVVIDECCYEGNLPNAWGNLSPEEMVRRFWETTVGGGYCGHGETYLDGQDVIWWAKGGVLKGKSPQRIAFLRRILEEIPQGWIDPQGRVTNNNQNSAGQRGRYYLTYFGCRQPGEATLNLPEGIYRADLIDTWEMNITPLQGTLRGSETIALPSRPYMALRVQSI